MRFDTSNLARFQADFLQTITTANAPAHPAMRIHHDTCLLGRIDALCTIYEITEKALGADAFKAFARDYVRNHVAASGDMAASGAGFADYLAAHPHSPDWLADLVRFEGALHDAHHAEDAPPCDFADLLDPVNAIALHPSAHIIPADFDAAALYAAIRDDAPLPERPQAPHLWLIGRTPVDEAVWLAIKPFEADFMTRIAETRSLLVLLEQFKPTTDDMTLLQTLVARLVAHGLLILSEIPHE